MTKEDVLAKILDITDALEQLAFNLSQNKRTIGVSEILTEAVDEIRDDVEDLK